MRFGHGVALWRSGQHDEAIKQFEWASALRPRHYHLWLELGRMRRQAGDQQGALVAFREAVRRAPYYAQPRWQCQAGCSTTNHRDTSRPRAFLRQSRRDD
ncbi:MAG: tetratricopeptide repeat protein [Acidobacteria bacterium]|nr:tetratricopeptide repeat protein [Acidobacteriota bacterium]